MDANRTLDALIAERVMGLLTASVNDDVRYVRVAAWDEWINMPAYSTDIAAAWQVVEAMERRGMWAEMRTPFGTKAQNLDDGYWCGFTPHGTSGWNGTPDNWTSAKTLPLAICRAALAALEAQP